MKIPRPLRISLFVALCCGVSGCAQMGVNWPPWLDFSPPPRRSSARYAPPAPVAPALASPPEPPLTETSLPPRRFKAKLAPPPAPPPQTAAPKVTLGGGQSDRQRKAIQLLNQVESQLRDVDRAKLKGAAAATYDEATTFAQQARNALNDGDYDAASGFAAKASLLSGKIVPDNR